MLRRHLCLAGLIAVLATRAPTADACSQLPPCDAIKPLASETEAEAKLNSSDPTIAGRAAFTLARSTTARHVKAVGRLLLDAKRVKAILDRADNGRRCLMPAILRALAENHPEGRAPFVALIESKTWAENPNAPDGSDLADVLLRATAAIRPPPPEVVAYWDAHVEPQGGWVNVTAMVLPENGSPAAIDLFHRMLKNPKHDVDTRKSWLHTTFIEHRNEKPLLEMARRLLLNPMLRSSLRHALAEAVFDYRQSWYGKCSGPTPPTVAQYNFQARAEVREIAALVAKADAQLVAAMTKMLTEFDKVAPK